MTVQSKRTQRLFLLIVGLQLVVLLCGLSFIGASVGAPEQAAVDSPTREERTELPTRVERAVAPDAPPTFTRRPVVVTVAPASPTAEPLPPEALPPEGLPSHITQAEAAVIATERARSLSPTEEAAPNATPTADSQPTDSPFNLVSTLEVGDWAITLERVEVTERIPGAGASAENIASGRYAILFLEVRNVADDTSTFVPSDSIAVFDDSGNEYEEDVAASSDAQLYFETETGTSIAPGETARVVAVYDLRGPETTYYIGPGVLADSQPNRLRFEAPQTNTIDISPSPTATP